MILKKIAIVMSLLFLASCSHTPLNETKETVIASTLKANQFSNVYFSRQPTDQEILQLKKEGFSSVINLRAPSEYDETAEAKLVKGEGLSYINVPLSSSDQLDDSFLDKVTLEVKKHRKSGKVLIHCSSGNRAGIWAGGHFFKDHGFSKEDSVKIAKKLGITKAGAKKKLEDYLAKEQ